MSDRDSTTDGIERRGVLAALATGIGGAGLARGALASRLDAPDETGFVVEQGDRCVPIAPLSGDETVEAFYDYRTPFTSPSGAAYSSYGTTDLQRPETSVCFLYDGPEGLSLVVVHDKLNDGTSGGAVTFDLAFEHPDRGSWVVGDDDYDAASNYDTFDRTAEGWSVDWTWADGRSDGGAYRPLGESFAVTIDPAFNEAAALYGDHYEGEITDWQVLSGDRDSPDRVSLALDEPLTIRSGTCAGTTTTTTTTRETTDDQTTMEDETTTEKEEDSADQADAAEQIAADLTVVPGAVNPRSHGRLPVVVRSTQEFDATALARGSVELRPGEASPVKRVPTDRDGDGRRDLELHFWTDAIDLDWETERLELTGETVDGRRVVATADLRLVPNGDDGEESREDDEDDERERREEGDDERDDDEDRDEDDERAEQDEDDGDPEREEGDEDDRPGRRAGERRGEGRGRGDGEGPGNGRGRGRGTGRGAERGDGRGKGRGDGRGRGRGNGRGGGRDD